MPQTKVMLIGALPAQSGFPGAGGPVPPSSRYPYAQPDFRMNRHAVIPSTWEEPQNLLQVTDKTNYDPYARASGGSAISPALRGLGSMLSPVLGATDTAGGTDDEATKWKYAWAYSATSMALLGGVMAGVHGYRRNKGATGWAVVWGLFGAAFPLVTNGVALAQGFGKAK